MDARRATWNNNQFPPWSPLPRKETERKRMSPDGIIDKESIVSLIGKLWGNFATGRVGRVSLDCVDYLNCQAIVGVLEGTERGRDGERGRKQGPFRLELYSATADCDVS